MAATTQRVREGGFVRKDADVIVKSREKERPAVKRESNCRLRQTVADYGNPKLNKTVDENSDAKSVREALNRHGVFFKKGVLSEIARIPGLQILGEEIGTTFGGTRVADIVARECFGNDIELRLVFECKRVSPEKRWVFFPHTDRQHRVSRVVKSGQSRSDFDRPKPADRLVCSEGLEFPTRSRSEDPVADQDPVFKTATQLSTAFLGLTSAALKRERYNPTTFRFAPLLVTTAQLCVAKHSWESVPLASGRIEAGELELIEVQHLVLKHPTPTPEGMESDFRQSIDDPWAQVFAESIYVVRATALTDFLCPLMREFIAQI